MRMGELNIEFVFKQEKLRAAWVASLWKEHMRTWAPPENLELLLRTRQFLTDSADRESFLLLQGSELPFFHRKVTRFEFTG